MAYERHKMTETKAMTNDNEPLPVYFITGRARLHKGRPAQGIHVLLRAPDDDTAVRLTLESLAAQGYVEAELNRIGDFLVPPDDEPYRSAWQSALDGEIAIVTFVDPFGDD